MVILVFDKFDIDLSRVEIEMNTSGTGRAVLNLIVLLLKEKKISKIPKN